MKTYTLRPPPPDDVRKKLAKYPPLLQDLLYIRGILDETTADDFLYPDYERHVHDPYLMKDMDKAVSRVLKAIEENERVIIYSDYDADGIPGAVVLHDFFKKIGFNNFENYFPHRYEEGYGLNVDAVETFYQSGAKLMITIDCGISDFLSVERANETGIDVIITDHHIAQDGKVPQAHAILNPKQIDCPYPYEMLCGSGVIYKLIQAILSRKDFGIKKGMEKWFLDMVGLATMADMVPLKDENRVFAYYGLKVLRKSPRLGLSKMLRAARVDQRFLNEDDIGFCVVPRINAASRMGSPVHAFELLTAIEEDKADFLSAYLTKINDERKGMSAYLVKDAKMIVERKKRSGNPLKIIVLGNPKWRPTLLGPVANNILESYGVPVFLWGRADGAIIKGSARSDGGINVLDLMQKARPDTFLAFGGHKCSGGFSISHEKIHSLEAALMEAFDKNHKTEKENKLYADKKMEIDDVTWDTYEMVELLSPFGEGNPKPTFLFENVPPSDVKFFGKEKNHLELSFSTPRNRVKAISFFFNNEKNKLPEVGRKVNLVATLEKSNFRSFPELRLRIVDIF